MFLKSYCMEFMILLVTVCITLKSTILSLIIFNLCFVFYISLILLEFVIKFHNLNMKTYISTNKSDNLKTIRKLKTMGDNIVDEYVLHNMTIRNMKSVQ